MSVNPREICGQDIPIVKLIPRNERKIATKYRKRVEASLKAVGLLEPLIVFPVENVFEILDGCLRFRILLDWGVETVPCLVAAEREAFTGNRMVNQLSASQEMRMLRKSLEELDEKTIASALGLTTIQHRVNRTLLAKLAPGVAGAFEAGKLNLQAAKELTHVKPDRQLEILSLLDSCQDYGVTFIRGLVLKTPAAKRTKSNGAKTPWVQAGENRSLLLRKLREAEQQQDFYSGLYRQYTTNLLKLVIYIRSLVYRPKVREYLVARHPQQLEVFDQIIQSTEH